MLQLKDFTYAIGQQKLLNDVDWVIHPGKKMALIGPNGAGKTTLLRLIHGDLQPDAGEIMMSKDTMIGYLPQEETAAGAGSLLESVMNRQQELTRIGKQIHAVQHQLDGNKNPSHDLLEKLGRLEHHFAVLGGYEMEHEAKRILSGLGFQDTDFNRPLSEFSGGWRMRSVLAGLLLQDPDVLLLDEPTNHLDLPSLEWLETYLQRFPGSVVIVSHDRFFIDRIARDIYELDRGRLTHYAGNYHFYEQKKKENLDLIQKQWKEQQDFLKQQQQFVDRFRYKATKAAQVQSRIKQLEKVDLIELPNERRVWSFNIKVQTESYKDVLKMEQMSFRYDQEWIFENVNFQLYRGERIALVGPNGVGKTTLTRLIYGDLTPQTGAVSLGHRVEVGYYSQHQIDALNLNRTVIEEVSASAIMAAPQQIRDVLGIFQFTGDTVRKPIKVLSGGEKARVSLAKILLSSANYLIMDEPTNHLDMVSKEALEQALLGYTGTLMLISHDRYFLSKLVHRVIEIKDRHFRIYEGDYNDYLAKRAEEMEAVRREDGDSLSSAGKKSKDQKRVEAEKRTILNRTKRPVEQKIRQIEDDIATLEGRNAALENQLADQKTYQNPQKLISIQKEYADVKLKLASCYSAWEEAHEVLEKLMHDAG